MIARCCAGRWAVVLALAPILFMGWGFGLFGQLSIVWVPWASLAIFVAQVGLSKAWLARFRFGPFEWLWRSLTYGHSQPMRRAIAAA